ncbi:alkaline phosphatase family protein [Halomicrobium salinisoli]|uniref:alkaline phosphatase family protein n=1 Tax=Halomicrobium salinisoli TaxID=2878391 RepID=UPI001CEFEC75|nr:alkaline phosphatase family protein [Halomicrobium salinisoli]
MTTVVLGWDGLDHEVATSMDIADRFVPHHRDIETIDNPVLGEPHTQELWPSIVTGAHPAETGIRAATEDGGTDWDDPRIDRLSSAAAGIVPEDVRTRVGRWLRNRGAELDAYEPADYAERGLSTVFDGRSALPVAVPNYRTETDAALDVVYDRGAQLADYLTVEEGEDGEVHHDPSVPLPVLEQRIASEAASKLGVVETALHRGYDLIFVWLGYLDTVGHLAPTVGDDGWRRRHYEQAARWTADVRDLLGPDDVLIVTADHGLQDGEHSHSTFYGATDEAAVEGVESVLDVAAAVDAVTERSSGTDVAERRAGEVESVRSNLEDLGYI